LRQLHQPRFPFIQYRTTAVAGLKCCINLDVGAVVSDTREGTDDALRDLHSRTYFLSKWMPGDIHILKQFWFVGTQWKNR
jgi:hypothetical protein